MQQPRKHHFVQAAHIRLFTQGNGIVNVYSKDGKKFKMTPEGLFKKKYLNSYRSETGINSDFEEFVTEIENRTFPAVDRIARVGSMAADDLLFVTAYLALSRIRNPSIQTGVINWHRNVVRSSIGIIEKLEKLPSVDFIGDGKERGVSELIENGLLGIEINNSIYLDKIFDLTRITHNLLLNGFGWGLVFSPSNNVAVSDHPLTICHPGVDFGVYGIPPGGEKCEVAFPICRNTYLLGIWGHDFNDIASESVVRELNMRQAIFASRHVASSSASSDLEDMTREFREWSYRTRADTIPYPNGAFQIIRSGVFLNSDAAGTKQDSPMLRTRSAASIDKDLVVRAL